MADTILLAIITGIFSLLSIIVVTVGSYAVAKINAVSKTVDKIHDLSNSAMGMVLLSNMNFAEFKSATTGDMLDIEIAKKAKSDYEEHARKQKIVDDKIIGGR